MTAVSVEHNNTHTEEVMASIENRVIFHSHAQHHSLVSHRNRTEHAAMPTAEALFALLGFDFLFCYVDQQQENKQTRKQTNNRTS